MLTGKELAAAIRRAMDLKGTRPVDLANHFGIRAPSVQGWLKNGTVGKARLPELWLYFSDVVGPDHWGMNAWPHGAVPGAIFEMPTDEERAFLDDFRLLPDEDQHKLAAEVHEQAERLRVYLNKQLHKFQNSERSNPAIVDLPTKPTPNVSASTEAPAIKRYGLDSLVGGSDNDGSKPNRGGARGKDR